MSIFLSQFKSLLCIIPLMSIFTSCLSPEEKIKEDIEYKTEAFRNSDSDYFVQDSKVYIYNTANNINYLANENIRDLAISYANNLGRAEYNRKQAQKYRTSTKFDKDYNPNWFEEAKIAEKTAEEHQRYANKNKTELLQLKDSLKINNVGGIWVYHEITYKEYVYRYYAGPYVRRTLYLFSEDGERILWSNQIDFYNDTFLSLLSITNTRYDNSSESTFQFVRAFCIAIIVALFIALIVWGYKREEAIRNAKKEKDKAEKLQIEKEREEVRLKAQKEWENLLEERIKVYGGLTKQINIGYKRENNIYVYEESKTIFIMGKKYMFKEIISCNIEKSLYRKGRTTQTTTPDKFEMAEQQVLWGMGQKYNVKSTTRIEQSPDIYKYIVYIGINSISTPQIQFTLSSIDVANEINNLINVIIALNNNSNH